MSNGLTERDSTNLQRPVKTVDRGKSILLGVLVVGALVAAIEIGRRLGFEAPVPFLLLLAAVTAVAGFRGKWAGVAGGIVASLFIFYSKSIGFGPESLIGGPVQIVIGAMLMLAGGYFLGRMRDVNLSLIRNLEITHNELERRVEWRTAELSALNDKLTFEIGERRQIEEALQARESYYRLLIENALDIITVLNADGTIRFESSSITRVLGYGPEELVGESVFDYIHPDDVAHVRKVFEASRSTPGQPSLTELRFRHKDGSWRLLEAAGNNLISDPNVAGAIVNSRDITQRRAMEKAVQRQEQLALVGKLAAGIAHDFNNAMAVIVLYAQLLNRSPNLTDKERRQVNTIFKEGNRAAELTTQILDFGRQTILDRRNLNLVPLLQDFVKLLRRTFAENYEIELDFEQEQYVVNADSGRIQQALMNLALNARDAMPQGGRIRFQLNQVEIPAEERETILSDVAEADWVQIAVSDNGSGISAEAQDHLFEPFFTTKEPGKGSGLGLAQLYGIVKQHNGFISVDSQPGEGTTIIIALPLVRERMAEVRPPTGQMARGNREIILVVEDNYATRIALMAALESLNYTVKGAKDGLEGLTLLERHRHEVKLVLSDVVMPQMGGIALLETMAERGIDIPAVLLTGNTTTEEMVRVQSEGKIEWHSKPIPLERLARIVADRVSGDWGGNNEL